MSTYYIDLKGEGYETTVILDVDSFPHCCGAKVVHHMNRRDIGCTKYHAKIAKQLTQTFLAKGHSELPKGVSIYRNAYDHTGRVKVESTSTFLGSTCAAKFIIADAVWGEDCDENEFSLYKWGMLGGDAWQKGTHMKNPNSDNKIAIFELTKEWSEHE